MDVERIRRDFPILARTSHGKPMAYLDSAATSQKPSVVLDAEREFYERLNANVHRGVYQLSEEATDAFEKSREHVAQFLGGSDSSEVVFLRGTTEAINLVATSFSRGILDKGDQVVSTIMEHHSNIIPWHFLRAYPGITLDFVDVDGEGRLLLADYDRLLSRKTKVVTLTHVSNVLGTVNPVLEIAEKAHDVGALVVLDAAQSAPHLRLDVKKLGIDLLAFSGHKALGPTGIGVLWGRKELLERMPPATGGGEMIREVHTDRVSYREPPARFEAGTPNAGGAYALSRALTYLETIGFDEIQSHSRSLLRHSLSKAKELFGERLTVFGPSSVNDHEAVISFRLKGMHPHDIASLLDAEGIAIRSGHHCAQPLMERLGVPALSRASPYLYNTVEEMDRLWAALAKADAFFSRGGVPGIPSPQAAASAGTAHPGL
ncbi:MAG: SufS family cysteine desulfurase [Thermoplasmata archaeon]|nr:SufS family cysteine desulfurase [Thermoplasmata archaeon]